MTQPASRPPRFAQLWLHRFLPEEEFFEKIGDFEEEYHYKVLQRGEKFARSWYRIQVIKILPVFIKNLFFGGFSMFNNYLKIVFRNISRHKGYSFINIFGLALGLTCCILIMSWVRDEAATDKFHKKIDSIYLVRSIVHYGSEVVRSSGSVPALGPAIKEEFPEIINAARFSNGQRRHLIDTGEHLFRNEIQTADPQIFEMFTYPIISGNPKDVFSGPNVMVLSQSSAAKYFGDQDPIGRTITLDKNQDFRIVGIMSDIPHNSSIRFDIWIPIEMTTKWYRPNYLSTWYNLAFRTYVEMADPVNLEAFNQKIFNRIRQSDATTNIEPFIYPFRKMYLELWGRIDNIRIFSVIALLILVIACINFMNLTTARSTRRAREVGLRKVVGAYRKQIMRQFFGESILFTIVSFFTACLFIVLLLPAFRSLTGKPIGLLNFTDPFLLIGIVSVILVTGLVSGSYPALFLSGFRPAEVLTGTRGSSSKGGRFRKILVVAQFSLSIMLIIATSVIFSQIRYLKSKNLGYDREHMVYIPLEGELVKKIEPLKLELMSFPGIGSISATSHSPTGIYSNGEGWDWEGRDPNVNPLVTFFGVDPDFLNTFKMEMKQGESFFKDSSQTSQDVIINDKFAQIMNQNQIIGARLTQGDTQLRVIGVVKDFHFTPLNREIGPILLFHDFDSSRYHYLFIRLNPGNPEAALEFIKKTTESFNPGFPVEFQFLDQEYDRLYRGVEREMSIVRTFAFLAILISCLGLFGLAAYTAEQRTKEIGIRKVLGASAPEIFYLLSKDYAKWITAANLIAWPVSYYLMWKWLQDFSYRTGLNVSLFLAAGLASFAVAILTICFQAVRTGLTNPVDSLRHE